MAPRIQYRGGEGFDNRLQKSGGGGVLQGGPAPLEARVILEVDRLVADVVLEVVASVEPPDRTISMSQLLI